MKYPGTMQHSVRVFFFLVSGERGADYADRCSYSMSEQVRHVKPHNYSSALDAVLVLNTFDRTWTTS